MVMKNRQVVTDESHISGGVVLATEEPLPTYLSRRAISHRAPFGQSTEMS